MTNRATKNLLSTALAALALACSGEVPPEPQEAPPELSLSGARLRLFRGDVLRATGQAAQATFRTGLGDVGARNLTLLLQGGAPADRVFFEAAAAEGNLGSQEGKATGGVALEDAQGTRGTTGEASLDGKAHRVTGPGPVDVLGASFTARGEGGFELDVLRPGQLQMNGPVTTRVGGTR